METQACEYKAVVTTLKQVSLKRKDDLGNTNPYSKVFKKATYLVLIGSLIEKYTEDQPYTTMIYKETLDKIYLTEEGRKIHEREIKPFIKERTDSNPRHPDEVKFVTLRRDTIVSMVLTERLV